MNASTINGGLYIMSKWKVSFWTPGSQPIDDGRTFGCAVHGYCNNTLWVNPDVKSVVNWNNELEGIVLSGSYEEVIDKIKTLEFTPKIAVAVFSKAMGMEDFICTVKSLVKGIPMVGGGAALGPNQTIGEILPSAEEVALLLVSEGDFKIEVMNVHKTIEKEVLIETTSPRFIHRIKEMVGENWENAAEYFIRQQNHYGLNSEDFESFTFSNENECNIHCSVSKDGLKSGANLPKNNRLISRLTDKESATKAIALFISSENALVFGCAGLRGLLKKEITSGENSLAGFLFGELVTLKDESMFGNLMMVKFSNTQRVF